MFRHSLFSLWQEHSLRAVRYLPDILALLRILTDRFHRRIDREKLNQLKIRELLQELPKKGSTVHPYLSKVFASDLCSETWCQNIAMKSFSPSCMFSPQLRDQFLIMHVCNANWKLSVSDNVQRLDVYKLLEKNTHQLCIPLQHLFLVSKKLLVLFIIWSFTHGEKPLHSLQCEESRFLYFTNTCIINYHELSVLIHSLEKSTTVDLIFEI